MSEPEKLHTIHIVDDCWRMSIVNTSIGPTCTIRLTNMFDAKTEITMHPSVALKLSQALSMEYQIWEQEAVRDEHNNKG